VVKKKEGDTRSTMTKYGASPNDTNSIKSKSNTFNQTTRSKINSSGIDTKRSLYYSSVIQDNQQKCKETLAAYGCDDDVESDIEDEENESIIQNLDLEKVIESNTKLNLPEFIRSSYQIPSNDTEVLPETITSFATVSRIENTSQKTCNFDNLELDATKSNLESKETHQNEIFPNINSNSRMNINDPVNLLPQTIKNIVILHIKENVFRRLKFLSHDKMKKDHQIFLEIFRNCNITKEEDKEKYFEGIVLLVKRQMSSKRNYAKDLIVKKITRKF
jgi:hypothetical protein